MDNQIRFTEGLRASRKQSIANTLESKLQVLNDEGFDVEFGTIGTRTTYALMTRRDSTDNEEYVGYTYIRNDIRFKDETVGKLKALDQAITRRDLRAERLRQIVEEAPDLTEDIPQVPEI